MNTPGPSKLTLTPSQEDFINRFILALPEAGTDAFDTAFKTKPEQISLVALQKARLSYVKARAAAEAELKELEQAIVEVFSEEPDSAEMAVGAKRVHMVLDAIDERLVDCLDDALNAATVRARGAHCSRARTIIKEYSKAMDSDPILSVLDANPIHPVTVKSGLKAALNEIVAHLS